MSINNIVHSVTLDNEKCKGCTNCVKRCPTAAIRVRDKKAIILDYKCIDCGECIRVCPHHAKKAEMDQLSAVLDEFDYTIALPAPTLYGQFPGVRDRNIILTALKHIGFDDVFEVAAAAEMVSAATRRNIMAGKLPHPAISSACPTVVRIIRARFPSLLPHLIPYHAPMELSARWAKRLAVEKTGLSEDKIGCVFISPCTAKCSSIKTPFGTEKSSADAAVSISDIYTKLLAAIKNVDEPEDLARSWRTGVGWAVSGGECAGAKEQNYLAADGMENVISILEKLDDEKIENVDLIELNACIGGCVGGVLTVENPFIAKRRLSRLMTLMRPAMHPPGIKPIPYSEAAADAAAQFFTELWSVKAISSSPLSFAMPTTSNGVASSSPHGDRHECMCRSVLIIVKRQSLLQFHKWADCSEAV